MIINRKIGASAAIAALLVAGCAAVARDSASTEQSARACFFPREVQSWSEGEGRTVNFRVGQRRYFQADVVTSCPDIDWALRIGFDARGSISICEGDDARLIVPSTTPGPQTCTIDKIRELTASQVAALPKGKKP